MQLSARTSRGRVQPPLAECILIPTGAREPFIRTLTVHEGKAIERRNISLAALLYLHIENERNYSRIY